MVNRLWLLAAGGIEGPRFGDDTNRPQRLYLLSLDAPIRIWVRVG